MCVCMCSVPGHAKKVLKVNPETGEVSFIGSGLHGRFKWLRGETCGDKIYCIPSNADQTLKIDIKTQTCELIGPWKWHCE